MQVPPGLSVAPWGAPTRTLTRPKCLDANQNATLSTISFAWILSTQTDVHTNKSAVIKSHNMQALTQDITYAPQSYKLTTGHRLHKHWYHTLTERSKKAFKTWGYKLVRAY
jgi:hypothetical protein